MTTLYDLGENLNLIVEQIQDLLADGIDSDDERVQELLEKMVENEDEWENKAVNVAKFLNQIALDVSQIDSEIERLTKKKKSLSNAHSSLHDLLLWQMQNFGKEEIKNALISIKVLENPVSVVVKNEDAVPAQFKTEKITVTVNKNAIKLAMKENTDLKIDGIELVRAKKLAIK